MSRRPVVFVTSVHGAARTGPAIYSKYLFEHFRTSDAFDFHLVTLGATASDALHPSVHHVPPGRSSLQTYRRLSTEALKLARSLGPDTIVHGNITHLMFGFVDSEFPLLVQVNDYDSATALDRWREYIGSRQPRRLASLMWRRRIESRVLRAADLGVYNSEATRSLVRRSYGLADDRHVVVYKAVDVNQFRPPVSLPNDPVDIPLSGPRLIFVGSDWRRKGFEYLLQALPALVRLNREIVLDAVGVERADLSPDLERFMVSERLDAHINFTGRVSRAEIASHYWHADLAVLPSLREALGVSVLEALGAGLPVVASRVGGIPEILDSVGDGEMVEPASPRALEDAISRVLRDVPEGQPKRPAAGLQTIFGVETMLDAVEHLYSTMPLRRGAAHRGEVPLAPIKRKAREV